MSVELAPLMFLLPMVGHLSARDISLSLATKASILRVLPNPISSARIPPLHTGGGDNFS